MYIKILQEKLFFFLIVIVTGILSFAPAGAESIPVGKECFSTAWPSEQSSLQPDPSLVRGRLDNGFRYILKKNGEPDNRVAIFLDVQAGSLNEKDNQRGIAHFLEHMMFKGTVHFPGDSLIDYLESIGMNFGGDTNAQTTYDHTRYHLILPNGSEGELDNGFKVMADFAAGARLKNEQIDRERGVILAEKRARDSAAYRVNIARTEFALRGTRLPERLPIGEEKILRDADHELLKSFYDDWYRPDNMFLVAVGDMDPAVAEGLLKKYFVSLAPRSKQPECPDFGRLAAEGTEVFYRFEPQLGKTNVSIETFWDKELQHDSLRLERRDIVRYIGSMVMGYRIQKLQERGESPFSGGMYDSSDIVDRVGFGSISAQTDPGRWRESMSVLDKTLRQAIQYGFDEQEVKRAKSEIRADLEARVLNENSEDSRTIARRIIRNLNSDRVYQSPKQEMDLYGPIVDEISLEEINKEFRQVWHHANRLVSVVGDTKLGENGEQLIGEAYRQDQQAEIAQMPASEKLHFPYLTPPEAQAKEPAKKDFPDIEVERLVFTNGLIVNLKRTTFQENSVQAAAFFGSGEQSEPQPGMAMMSEEIINSSGTGRYTKSELDSLTAGSSVDWRFRIGESAFSWVGSALTKDFELFIQMLYAHLYDQGFRENQYDNVRSKILQLYQKASHEIDGAMTLEIQPFLADYNPHFGLPPKREVAKITFGQLKDYAESFSGPDDLEISVVGDFDRAEVVRTLSRYFGGVTLQPPKVPETPTLHFPRGRTLQVSVATSIDKSMVVVAWPTTGKWEISRTRRLQILAGVLEDRLRKTIRESLGATYSPQVMSFSSRVYRGYGFIIAQMVVKPGMEEQIIEAVLQMGDLLHREGVGEEELARVRKPVMTSLFEAVKTNNYWLGSVLGLSSRHPAQLDWPNTILSDFSSINTDDIDRLARQYLVNSAAAVARAMPSGLPEPGNNSPDVMAQTEKEQKKTPTSR